MASLVQSLRDFLKSTRHVAVVEVAAAKGSTPREKGAWMLVAADRIFGTIGGGQLEYMAIDKAREMMAHWSGQLMSQPSRNYTPTPNPSPQGGGGLGVGASLSPSPLRGGVRGGGQSNKSDAVMLSVSLGPEIGQCCGGRVDVSVRLVDEAVAADLVRTMEDEDARYPHVYVFGGGHVGHALANALGLLPLKTVIVETRAEELKGLPDAVETHLTAVPEEVVRQAPSGSAFIILTHDHALDFLIVAEALKRADAAYVGMIGSKTKKATFRSWYLKNAGGDERSFTRLVSPIGGDAVKDKRPNVIAAMAAAEVMTALAVQSVSAGLSVAKR